jgi:hypothetical protein
MNKLLITSKMKSITFLKSNSFSFILSVVVSVLTVWGVTSANFIGNIEDANQNFSLIGVVSEIEAGEMVLVGKDNADNNEEEEYLINMNHLEIIQTSEYVPLVINDISEGHQLVVQGVTDGKYYFAKRVISFSVTESGLIENDVEEVVEISENDNATSSNGRWFCTNRKYRNFYKHRRSN